MIAPIQVEIGRLVGKGILAAQFILNFKESVRHIIDLEGEERTPASRLGDSFQDFVSAPARAGHVGADGINDDLSPLRHFDCFFACDVTLIVVAVAQQNDGAPRWPAALRFEQLVTAGKIQSVVHRRSPAGFECTHAPREGLCIVGEILRDLGSHIKTDHERPVVSRPHRLIEKLDRRFLLKFETVTYRVAGIDQQSHLQRQVGLIVEAAYLRRRLAVINHVEIVLLQILDVAAVLIGDRENHIDFIDRNANGGGGILFRRWPG